MLWTAERSTTVLLDYRMKTTSGSVSTTIVEKNKILFVYADLECILEKTDDPRASQHHRVFSLAYYVYCSYDESLCYYRFCHDKDCVTWFVEKLRNLAHRVKSILSANGPMETSSSEQCKTFRNATQCHVCENLFASDTHVRDHCHLTRYRGPANSNCNLNYKDSHCIPVIFHNLSGYDAHFIIKEVATAYEGRITSDNERKIHLVYKKYSKHRG